MIDIELLREQADRFESAQMSPATERGYAHDFRNFTRWCKLADRIALPASSETVRLYAADQLSTKKVVSVYRYLAGVAFMHRREGQPSPVDDSVRRTLRGARRMRAEQPRQMRPLTIVELRQVAACLERQATAVSIRNRAILLVGFSSAIRRSNLAQLRVDDLTFRDEGVLLLLRREKQNREGGAGRIVPVPFGENSVTCPVHALQAWLKVRGESYGPLFTRLDNNASGPTDSISVNAICGIVKESIAAAGIDARQHGTHSLRSGFISEAGTAGISELVIANHSGHKSLNSLKLYYRPADLFKNCPAKLIGL